METIQYFTAGKEPNAAEQADIDSIKPLTEARYQLTVVNGAENNDYGTGEKVSDYVASDGPLPPPYDSGYPVFDPDSPPDPDLVDTKAIVNDGESFPVSGTPSGTVNVSVVGGVLSFSFP